MDDYGKALESARKEFAELASQRVAIDKRMALLKEMIEALIAIFESEALVSSHSNDSETGVVILNEGITDAIKRAFVFDYHLTPTEVRDKLEIMGFNLNRHTNPMATIHSVLKRLVEQDWLKPMTKGDKPAFVRSRPTRNFDDEVMRLVLDTVEPMIQAQAAHYEGVERQNKATTNESSGQRAHSNRPNAELTEPVRNALRANGGWMSADDIKGTMTQTGYLFTEDMDTAELIGEALKALRAKKAIKRGVKKPSRTAVYRWVPESK